MRRGRVPFTVCELEAGFRLTSRPHSAKKGGMCGVWWGRLGRDWGPVK